MQTRDKKQSKKIMKTVIKIGIELRSLPIQDDDSKKKTLNANSEEFLEKSIKLMGITTMNPASTWQRYVYLLVKK